MQTAQQGGCLNYFWKGVWRRPVFLRTSEATRRRPAATSTAKEGALSHKPNWLNINYG